MSLILEALRKSDRQRQRAAADRLREGPRPGQARSGAGWLTLLSGMLAILSLVVLVAFVVQQRADSPAKNTGDAPVVIMENDPAPPAAVRGLSSELPRQPQAVTPVAMAPHSNASPLAAESDNAVHDETPSLGELPDVGQAGLPALHVDVHAWAERPADRFVLINLRRYGEGDRIEEGALVRHIVPAGVILEYRGELYSLPRR